jgi:signal transduction histidine kinase
VPYKTLDDTNKKLDWQWFRNLIKLLEEVQGINELKSIIIESFTKYQDTKNIELIITESTLDDDLFEDEINKFVQEHELSHENIEELIIKRMPCKLSSTSYVFPLESAGRILGLFKIEHNSKLDNNYLNMIWGFSDAVSEIVNVLLNLGPNSKTEAKNTSYSIFNNMKGFLEASLERLKSVEEQNQQLIKINETRTELINNVSHELRTPLVSIMGFSKLLQRREIEQSLVLEASEQIQSAGSRLSRMIDDLIQLNRANTQGWQLNVERLDLGEIGKIVIESLSPLNKKHKFSFDYPEDYPMIEGDRKLLRQVIENLLLNSLKYSPKGGEISMQMTLDKRNQRLNFSVKDEGIGMTSDEQSKIFDRFYRAKNKNTENISGLGLGLSICKDVIEALNGTITCESKYNEGSIFTISMRY